MTAKKFRKLDDNESKNFYQDDMLQMSLVMIFQNNSLVEMQEYFWKMHISINPCDTSMISLEMSECTLTSNNF